MLASLPQRLLAMRLSVGRFIARVSATRTQASREMQNRAERRLHDLSPDHCPAATTLILHSWAVAAPEIDESPHGYVQLIAQRCNFGYEQRRGGFGRAGLYE